MNKTINTNAKSVKSAKTVNFCYSHSCRSRGSDVYGLLLPAHEVDYPGSEDHPVRHHQHPAFLRYPRLSADPHS